MKYYIVVKNSNGDNLAIFENFDEAVAYCESITAVLTSTFRIQLIPKQGV
jgi:hypothetical protein